MPGPLIMTTPAEAIRDGGNVRVPTIIRFQPTLSPAAVVIGPTAVEQLLTVAGLLTTDVILSVNKPTTQTNLGITGWRAYSVASQIAVAFATFSASVTPTASEIYQVIVLRGR